MRDAEFASACANRSRATDRSPSTQHDGIVGQSQHTAEAVLGEEYKQQSHSLLADTFQKQVTQLSKIILD